MSVPYSRASVGWWSTVSEYMVAFGGKTGLGVLWYPVVGGVCDCSVSFAEI